MRLNDSLKLYKIFLNKFIFCFLIGAIFIPCKYVNCQQEKEAYDSVFVKQHSPRKAWLFSAVFPGLGQIYNRKYWKVPIIYGIGGAVIFTYFWNHNYYTELDDAYKEFTSMDPRPEEYVFKGTTLTYDIEGTLDRVRNSVRDDRDLSAVGIAAVYFLNIIDAMIDAHFFEYDVSDDLSFKLMPSLIPKNAFACSMGLKLSVKF